MRDLHNNIRFKMLTAPDQQTASFQSASIDLSGFDSAELVAMFGDAGNTLGASPEVSLDFIVQESDDDSVFTAVTDANDLLFGANGNVATPDSLGVIATLDNDGDQDKLLRVGYRGTKRYIRFSVVENGDAGSFDIAILGIRSHAAQSPIDDVAAEINL